MAEIVTGQFRNKGKWLWIAAFIAVIVLGIAAGVGLRWMQTRDSSPKTVVGTVKPKTKAQQALDLAISGDYTEAQTQIAAGLKQPNLSTDQKYDLYIQQGSAYQNSGDNASALASYKQAAATKQTQSVYEALGGVSKDMGDTVGAITYYKKAITLIPDGPVASEDKAADQQIITNLGGQP